MKTIRVLLKYFISRVLHTPLASFCKHCGRRVHDFVVDDEVWEVVEPHIKTWPLFGKGHVLCYDCFCEVCKKVGLPSYWFLKNIEEVNL